MARVLETDVQRMVESAGGDPKAVLIAGDLVGGRWPHFAANLKSMFGNGSTDAAAGPRYRRRGLLHVGPQALEHGRRR